MAIHVRIPTPLRRFSGERAEIEVRAASVGEALERLFEQHPALRSQILHSDGGLRSFVNVYRNGEDVRLLDGLDSSLAPGDELAILPAIAGGAGWLAFLEELDAGRPFAEGKRPAAPTRRLTEAILERRLRQRMEHLARSRASERRLGA